MAPKDINQTAFALVTRSVGLPESADTTKSNKGGKVREKGPITPERRSGIAKRAANTQLCDGSPMSAEGM